MLSSDFPPRKTRDYVKTHALHYRDWAVGHLAMQPNMNCSCKNELKSQDDMRSQVGKGRIGKQVQFGGREKIGEDVFSEACGWRSIWGREELASDRIWEIRL